MEAFAGNRGENIRSDCYVSIKKTKGHGIKIHLTSKVDTLYGNSIRRLCQDILDFFKIKNAVVEIDDKGALPFAIAARLEAAICTLISTDKEYLSFNSSVPHKHTTAKRQRRSRLYIPGNNPKLMINAGIYKADGIILDLEDSVAPDKKDEARILVRNALKAIDFGKSERMVRINQLPLGLKDLQFIIPQNVDTILVPKCETPNQIKEINNCFNEISGANYKNIHLMPIIESALGVENAFKIASAETNVVALAIGLEDYTADIGTTRSISGKESFYARCAVVNAATAAGIQAIDSVFSDIDDMDALRQTIAESRSLGFVGMGCIHPAQVAIVNDLYGPTTKEIQKAKRIVLAFEDAQKKGLGVVALGSKMIDPPVVKRAMLTINLAIETGKLKKGWRAEYEK